MTASKFQRTKFRAYVKLGSGQKSKQKYRKATGRHNKTRQKWKSRPSRVEIGYKGEIKTRGLVRGKKTVVIKSTKELDKLKENEIPIIGKVGMKRKIEIVKEAEKKKIRFANLNIKKFLRKIERMAKHKEKIKAEKKEKHESKKKKEEKAKAEKKGEPEAEKQEKKKEGTGNEKTEGAGEGEQGKKEEVGNKTNEGAETK